MSNVSHWGLLRCGQAEQALAKLREAWTQNPIPSHIMGLGVVYLWLEDYRAAAEHFQRAIETHGVSIAKFYGMRGVAEWCNNEPDKAIGCWQAGLDAQYADGAGGIDIPLLLFVASVLQPEAFAKKRAEAILTKRVQDPRVKNWPGPIAKFALGLIDQPILRQMCTGINDLNTLNQHWQASFYEAVLDFERGKLKPLQFKQAMKTVADTSVAERVEQRAFLSLLWSEEFFIARYVAQADSNIGKQAASEIV